MALKLTKTKKADAETSTQIKNGGEVISEKTETEKVDVPVSSQVATGSDLPFCEVGVEASYTHNLGNYQSARVQVSLRVPCLPKEIDDTFVYAHAWVDKKLTGMVEELQEQG